LAIAPPTAALLPPRQKQVPKNSQRRPHWAAVLVARLDDRQIPRPVWREAATAHLVDLPVDLLWPVGQASAKAGLLWPVRDVSQDGSEAAMAGQKPQGGRAFGRVGPLHHFPDVSQADLRAWKVYPQWPSGCPMGLRGAPTARGPLVA